MISKTAQRRGVDSFTRSRDAIYRLNEMRLHLQHYRNVSGGDNVVKDLEKISSYWACERSERQQRSEMNIECNDTHGGIQSVAMSICDRREASKGDGGNALYAAAGPNEDGPEHIKIQAWREILY